MRLAAVVEQDARYPHALPSKQVARAIVAHHDADRDGRIAHDETPRSFREDAFTAFDANRDGFADRAERSAAVAASTGPDLPLVLAIGGLAGAESSREH